MPTPGNTTDRGYGHRHRQLRLALLPYAYGEPCPKCGHPMLRGQALDLGHTDDRTAYTGIEHARCNRQAGAIKGHAGRQARRPQVSRAWLPTQSDQVPGDNGA